jgi:uncharacterized SAM-binding protein YcdF (DUF218 family)
LIYSRSKYWAVFVLIFLIFLIGLEVISLLNYVKTVNSYENNCNEKGLELVVVLTGDVRRIKKAYKLSKIKNKKLFIVGVSSEISYKDIEKEFNINEADHQNIFIDKKSKTTYENIKILKKYIKKNKIKKIVLVTSFYHFKRVDFLLNKMLIDLNVEVFKCSADDKGLNINNYDFKTLKKVFLEQIKFQYYKLRFLF